MSQFSHAEGERIDGRHVYRYLFVAEVRSFTQLPPNYVHVRVSDAMRLSPSSTPRDEVFGRRDVYVRPSN